MKYEREIKAGAWVAAIAVGLMGLGMMLIWTGLKGSIPDAEAQAGVYAIRSQALRILLASLFLCFGLGFWLERRRVFPFSLTARGQGETAVTTVASLVPSTKVVMVLHGSIRGIEALIDGESPERVIEWVEWVNHFFELSAYRAREYQGTFERYAGTSFIAFWELPLGALPDHWQAIRMALELRNDFRIYNHQRKTDGLEPLSFGMGVHCGLGIFATIGPEGKKESTVLSGVHPVARALDRISVAAGVDLLVSEEAWKRSEAGFIGARAGESKLTAETGLMSYYSVSGYRNDQGQEVWVEPLSCDRQSSTSATQADGPSVIFEKSRRWQINNGTQMVGPLTAEEIAKLLFAQEMDFDSECWEEGSGACSMIKNARIFSGSTIPSEGARLWLYDGQMIHGPLTTAFLVTALKRGAVSEDAYVCEESTVHGWKSIGTWAASHSLSNSQSKSGDDSRQEDAA